MSNMNEHNTRWDGHIMSDPFEQSLIDLGLSVVGWSTKYSSVTLHRRPIFGGKQKYRKVFYAWVERKKGEDSEGNIHWRSSDVHKLKSKSDSKGQAQHEARLLFKEYYPNRSRKLHIKEELVPIKHRQKKSQATTPDS